MQSWHSFSLILVIYSKLKSNYSLFTKLVESNFTAILVCVDDLVLAGNYNLTEIDHMKRLLDDKFSIKVLV